MYSPARQGVRARNKFATASPTSLRSLASALLAHLPAASTIEQRPSEHLVGLLAAILLLLDEGLLSPVPCPFWADPEVAELDW
jgi:hypothetical protein